jgi:hypothetical protein
MAILEDIGKVLEHESGLAERIGKETKDLRPSLKARTGRRARTNIKRKVRSKLLPVYHGTGADLSGGFNLELGGSATVSNLSSLLGPNFISNPLEAIDYGIGSAEKLGTRPRLYRATVNPATHLQERTHQEFITKHVMPLFPGGDVGQISSSPTLEQVGKIREHLLGQGYESVGFSYGNRGGKAGAEASHIIFLKAIRPPEADIQAATYAEKKMQELYGVTEFMPSAHDKDVLRYSRLQRDPRVVEHNQAKEAAAARARQAATEGSLERGRAAEAAIEADPDFDPFDDKWLQKLAAARTAAQQEEPVKVAARLTSTPYEGEDDRSARFWAAQQRRKKGAVTQPRRSSQTRHSSARVGLRTHSSTPARFTNNAMTTVDRLV